MNERLSLLYSKEPSIGWMVPFYKRELSLIISAMLLATSNAKIKELLTTQDLALEILFVSDATMAKLNVESMECSGPTNVLSFPSRTNFLENSLCERSFAINRENIPSNGHRFDNFPLLGVLVLAPSTVLRECFLYNQSPQEHFIRLFAHGLSHLMGLDHGSEMDSLCAIMEKEANKYLA